MVGPKDLQRNIIDNDYAFHPSYANLPYSDHV